MSPSTYCALNRLATTWNVRLALTFSGRDDGDFDIGCSDLQSAIRHHSKCPSFVFFVSRYLSLCGLTSQRIGTCSIISKPYPSRPTTFFGLLVRNRNCRTPKSKRICAPSP